MDFQSDKRLYSPRCMGLHPVEILHENPWFSVVKRGDFYTTEYAGAQVVILPVVEGEGVVMVRVRRPVIDDAALELPAGGFDLNLETPEQGAARELLEESGIGVTDSSRFLPLPPLCVSPNRNPMLAFVFQVNLSRGEYEGRGPHDHEVESVHCVSADRIREMILNGEIYIGTPMALVGRWLVSRNP